MDFKTRWDLHLRQLRGGYHHSVLLQRSWDKYGEQEFIWEVLEEVREARSLIRVEQRYLDETFSSGLQLNICPIAGSTLGRRHTAAAKAKMSAAHMGKKHSPEARRKMSAARKGKKNPAWALSAEGLETLRRTHRGNDYRKGKRHSKETKEKISKALTGRKLPQDHGSRKRGKLSASDAARIRQLAADGLKQKEIAAMFGVTQPTVSKVINLKVKADQ